MTQFLYKSIFLSVLGEGVGKLFIIILFLNIKETRNITSKYSMLEAIQGPGVDPDLNIPSIKRLKQGNLNLEGIR